ncbi:S1C family serine protease [Cryptosporangium aurantiacum]|uniref:Trypsin-like peptidase domain-containing protein n=1 Tax=Cryptosporangium aurantiacum TaxID=134849 RepID=A0A1M7R7A0_9ACTN|nr:S1C family serine protease [Cryptosporangium aurantiacum]SHN42164.1 Trypsin-like peptidase domain-containing protein [Cryptosporangium aurantiacum]
MSDRGDENSAAPHAPGAPTGPLPGPRPPTSGWSQQSPNGAYGGTHVPPPSPSQTTGAFGAPSRTVSAPPYGSGYPTAGQPGSHSSTSAFGAPAPTGPLPHASTQPLGTQPPGAQPLGGSPLGTQPLGGSPLGTTPPGSRPPSRQLGPIGFWLAVFLLIVVVVQAVLLARYSGDLDEAKAAQTSAAASAAKDREDLGNLTKRVQSLEERTKGTLNSTAVAKQVLPSVFSVRAGQATGTAFAFGKDAEGGTLLITNYHVVDGLVSSGGRNATIQRESESYPVTVEDTDKGRDLAVLRTTAKFTPLKKATVEVAPGDPVIVVGAPLGLTDTVTTGVVSAVRDDVQGLSTRVIQFDAAINPGNSGGPVINADGEVVGIAQAKIVAEGADGLGLAIPIEEVCKGLIRC